MAELAFFMDKSEVEQRLRLQNQRVTIEEYWQYKLGTSAIRVVLCLNDYFNETTLPYDIMHDPSMATLWNLTNINIGIVNDMISLKKEIAHGSVESLVPILYTTKRDVQAVADDVMESVRFTIAEFDEVASKLIKHCEDHYILDETTTLAAYVDGCRYWCTGNMSWR